MDKVLKYGLWSPRQSPHNTPTLPVAKPLGEQQVVQEPLIMEAAIPVHPLEADLYNFPPSSWSTNWSWS